MFHCTNPDFYFAPHPRHCGKYFICENYRIHDHQCGDGIFWDYVYNQCDLPEKSFCYSGETHPHYDETHKDFVETTTERPTFATTIAPAPGNLISESTVLNCEIEKKFLKIAFLQIVPERRLSSETHRIVTNITFVLVACQLQRRVRKKWLGIRICHSAMKTLGRNVTETTLSKFIQWVKSFGVLWSLNLRTIWRCLEFNFK